MGQIEYRPGAKQADLDLAMSSTKPAPKPVAAHRDPKHPTGNLTIDTGGMGPCKPGPDGDKCYLDPAQRVELVQQFGERVGRAHTAYVAALGDLRVDEVVKNTEELPWYVSLFLGATSGALEAGIEQGVESLARSGALRAFGSGVAKGGVDHAKDATKQVLGRAMSGESEASQQKQQALGFVEYLCDQSMAVFQHLAEYLPGVSNDVELNAAYDLFDGTLNTASFYKANLGAALARYNDSPVSKLGRRLSKDDKRGDREVELETRVAWLITPGAGKRLIYVDRAFSATYQKFHQQFSTTRWTRGSAYDSGQNQLSLQSDADWTGWKGAESETALRHQDPLGPDMMLTYVEPEFVELAVQKQAHIWLDAPETFMLDYSTLPPSFVKVPS